MVAREGIVGGLAETANAVLVIGYISAIALGCCSCCCVDWSPVISLQAISCMDTLKSMVGCVH